MNSEVPQHGSSDSDRWRRLHDAARTGDVEGAKLLLSVGEHYDRHMRSSMHHAERYTIVTTAQMFSRFTQVDAAAAALAGKEFGRTALHAAAGSACEKVRVCARD
jgi:hypothetical protein